ncbi:MAG: D-glycerate dehydrogenase [Polyangiales bacterium]
MPTVFVSCDLPANVAQWIDADIVVGDASGDCTRENFERGVSEADAAIVLLSDRVDESLLAKSPRLRIVANYAVGFDNIDIEAATKRGVWVSNTPGVLTEASADLAWTLILSAARRVIEGHRLVEAGDFTGVWPTTLLGKELHGCTLGVFGFGRIGQAVARRARAFGMNVIYTSRSPVALPIREGLQATPVTFDELIARSDVLSIHCPLTSQTRHLFNETTFTKMKNDALLINTARGPVVDEAALVDALDRREIGAAGLDVYEFEPNVHRGLIGRNDVVLLPHIGSATTATRQKMAKMAAENVADALGGRRPRHALNQVALR